MLHSKKRIASIIVLSVIIAAGALFTAVYDVLYKYTTTNTTILNAETVDKTGETRWDVVGSRKNCNETTAFSFDEGIYMLLFDGQAGGAGLNYGIGAVCIAFYKGNSMTVTIGVPGGKGGAEDGSMDGGGATYVQSNFALPMGTSAGTAIASGAGGGKISDSAAYGNSVVNIQKAADGTFKGYEGGIHEKLAWCGINITDPGPYPGTPASQTDGGRTYGGYGDTDVTPNTQLSGCGGGAGYYDGGASVHGPYVGGGGSCSPNCYPLQSSDISQTGPMKNDGERCRIWTYRSSIRYYRIDPSDSYKPRNAIIGYGGIAKLQNTGKIGTNPVNSIKEVLKGYDGEESGHPMNYDCGIRVGWVYSCSEDGEKWGASSDRLRSETKQDVWHNCAVIKPIYIKCQL